MTVMVAGLPRGEYLRKLRTEAKLRGDCYVCRCRPAKSGCSCCVKCIERSHARKRGNRKGGRCECGRKRAPGLRACRRCLDSTSARVIIQRAVRTSQGLCGQCGDPAVDGKAACAKHLAYHAAATAKLYAERHARGVCIYCQEPVFRPGAWRCEAHRTESNERRREAVSR